MDCPIKDGKIIDRLFRWKQHMACHRLPGGQAIVGEGSTIARPSAFQPILVKRYARRVNAVKAKRMEETVAGRDQS